MTSRQWTESSLIYGAYRLDNCMLLAGWVAAVLDWEMASLGGPLADVALYATYTGGFSEFGGDTGLNAVYGQRIDLDLEAAHKTVEVNALAALSWATGHWAWMAEHAGAVVNVSSICGLRADTGIGMHGASKAMLNHMTQQLAVELTPGVRVNAVAPELEKTEFATALYEGREEVASDSYPVKRLGVPEDVDSPVSFLLSEEAGWITGKVIIADGGLLV